MLTASFDLKKAFYSENREANWDLEFRWISTKIVDVITSLYSGTESGVKYVGGTSLLNPFSALA